MWVQTTENLVYVSAVGYSRVVIIRVIVLLLSVSILSLANVELSESLLQRAKQLNMPIETLYKSPSSTPVILQTDSIKLSLNQQVLKAQGNNIIQSQHGIIKADQIEFVETKSEIKFFGNVALRYNEMKLNSNEAYVKVNEDTFIAKNDVKFSFEDYKSTSQKAMFDSQLNQVVFEGDVEISSLQQFAKGDSIIFDLTQETFLSKGKAKIKLSKDDIQ